MASSSGRSCAATAEECLARYERTEERIRAFSWLDPERVRARARELDTLPAAEHGVLWGIPVGVKDIVDTAGVPTECGSALFAGRVPERSATLVERLEAAGAII